MELKVISWNIHHGENAANRPTLKDMAGFLQQEAPDIIGVNEVDILNPRSGFRHQPRYLAKALGYSFVFGPTLHWGLASYGNAVLSKGTIAYAKNLSLPSAKEKRACLKVKIAFPAGPSLTLYNTHLGLGAAERQNQVKTIVSDILGEEGPILLTGDLNADEKELKPLLGVLQDVVGLTKAGACTFPAAKPRHRIDFILCSSHFSIQEADVPVINCSDHLPVTANIKLVW